MGDPQQEFIDRFYFEHGKCCAGCDWWRSISSVIGDCTRSAPVSGAERAHMIGIVGAHPLISAGHVVTPREHVCGDFKDDFDWSTLPLPYRKRIGAPT
ncbi:hypothetical protein DEM27_10255 [Metarhizobium album]|uniref:Uncharacterized protein n=1 Tax=Metarhizobium album TaxID=2182425 RepID=A0A2U2DTV6_9HYPH|nr:hypothetical protein [Rhizobium album]PWE56736.1 hypothetical protein DEM27_10255 [Rhizobium album]